MASTRKTDKEKFVYIGVNIPKELYKEFKAKTYKLRISMNCIVQAAIEDFIDWNGEPRWATERELTMNDRKFKLKG